VEATFSIPGKIRIPKEFWTQKTPDSFHDHTIGSSSGAVSSSQQLISCSQWVALPLLGIVQQPAKQFFHGDGRGQSQSFILPYGGCVCPDFSFPA
jgi:hypothetical protein